MNLANEQRGVIKAGLLAALTCLAVLLPAVWLLPKLVDFPTVLAERFALTIQIEVVLALWSAFAIRSVSSIRFKSVEDNRGSAYGPPSDRLRIPAAFLQNTLEQTLIAVLAHMALATLGGVEPLAFIVGAVLLFSVGRWTFLAGYSRGASGRAYGMVLTMLPTIVALVWVVAAVLAGWVSR